VKYNGKGIVGINSTRPFKFPMVINSGLGNHRENHFFCGCPFFSVLASLAWGDLTDRWSGNDGGTCYLRQIGSQVFGYGEAAWPVKIAWLSARSASA
jgi:hypothetical protein